MFGSVGTRDTYETRDHHATADQADVIRQFEQNTDKISLGLASGTTVYWERENTLTDDAQMRSFSQDSDKTEVIAVIDDADYAPVADDFLDAGIVFRKSADRPV